MACWAFPDVWIACGHSRANALAVLGRWPHLPGLARARARQQDVVALHTRREVGDPHRRATHFRGAAAGWAAFGDGHLDLGGLAWEVSELLDHLASAEARVERAETQTVRRWEALWGDDTLLLSVSGMGPRTAPCMRAVMGDAAHLHATKRFGHGESGGENVRRRTRVHSAATHRARLTR